MPPGSPDTPYEAVIGLEIHVQLATRTKMFCRCENRYGAPPNTLTCPTCLGYPGTLPVPNRQAVDLALRLATALGATIHERSAFARKSYFYPDLPKGYQITQYDRPLATGGAMPLPPPHDRPIGLFRLHLEEDAGKLIHRDRETLADFNRCGVPLVEIVTRPDLRSPGEARDLLQELHRLLRYLGVSDASMDEGSLRCDANLSLRPPGGRRLGAKVEIKNLNSFRHVARALEHEAARQADTLTGGGRVAEETRSFDASTGATRARRSKEAAADYRYFPEPDLPPLAIGAERRRLAADLPELPWERRERLRAEHGLPAEDAEVLTDEPALADYFDRAAASAPPESAKAVGDWVRTEVLRELGERGEKPETLEQVLPAQRLADLVGLVAAGRVSRSAAKEVLGSIWGTGEAPAQAVERLDLARVSDEDRLAAWTDEVLAAHPDEVERFLAGKEGLLGFFVGRVMERSGGRADPRRVRELVAENLAGPAALPETVSEPHS